MQMYALGKQASLLRVKSQFLESHSEETIKAAPRLRIAAAPHVERGSAGMKSPSRSAPAPVFALELTQRTANASALRTQDSLKLNN